MDKNRTTQMNKSLHKLFTDISLELNSQGIDQKTIVEDLPHFSTPVTPEFIKLVWKSILYTMYRKTSTADMTIGETQNCYDVLNKFLGENYGVHLPWPSFEEMAFRDYYD